MRAYTSLFLMACLGSLYMSCYTTWQWYLQFYDTDVDARSWYQFFFGSPAETMSSLFVFLLLLVTLLIGAWIFLFNVRRSKKQSVKLRRNASIFAALTLSIVAIFVLPREVLLLAVIAIPAAIFVHYLVISCDSFTQIVYKLFVAFFIISIPWEFMKLYKRELALQHHYIMSNIPAGCNLPEPTLWSTLRTYFLDTFSWDKAEDRCIRYHTAMLVEPLWEITPLKVLFSLITTCITHPLELVASSIGECYQLLFKHLPLQWQPIVMLQITIFFIFLIITFCRYSLKIPWVLHFVPATIFQKNETLKFIGM